MIARDYIDGDFDLLNPGPDERMELAVMDEQFRTMLENSSGPIWTLAEGGDVMGLWGTNIDGDAGYAWAVLGDAARNRPISLHRAALRCLRASRETVKHLYGLTLPSAEAAHRWALRLGFIEKDTVEVMDILYRRYEWPSARQ